MFLAGGVPTASHTEEYKQGEGCKGKVAGLGASEVFACARGVGSEGMEREWYGRERNLLM